MKKLNSKKKYRWYTDVHLKGRISLFIFQWFSITIILRRNEVKTNITNWVCSLPLPPCLSPPPLLSCSLSHTHSNIFIIYIPSLFHYFSDFKYISNFMIDESISNFKRKKNKIFSLTKNTWFNIRNQLVKSTFDSKLVKIQCLPSIFIHFHPYFSSLLER